MTALIRALALTAMLVSCASPPPTAPPLPLQAKLATQNRTALTAFETGRYQQAADLYDQALATATAMDDSAAIVDAHYNRAVSLMFAENYSEAGRSIRRAEDELARAGHPSSPELTLLAATLAYRTGDHGAAWDLTAALIAPAAVSSPQVRERAWFLRGLLAKRGGNRQVLEDSVEALRRSPSPDTRPDRLELEGYRAAAAGDPVAAVAALDGASRYRNEIGDYRGMSRSLVAAAEVLEESGRKREAADRYLRAGRSAASRGSATEARTWLGRAEALADESGAAGIAGEARAQIQQIDERP